MKFLRTTEDLRYYHPINDDVVTALVRGQGGYITGWGGQQVPLLNSFFGGPYDGAGICAQRFWAARSHARHDHG